MRKFYVLLFMLFVGLLMLTLPGMSAEAAITGARLKPAKAQVGDTYELVIDYCLPGGAKLDRAATLKHYAGLTLTGFKPESGRLTLSFLNDRLASFTVPVRLAYAGQAAGQLTARPLKLQVMPRKNLKDIQPIRDIIPAKPWLKILLGLAAIALLALLGWLIWRLYERWRKPPYEAVEAPAKLALRRLREIDHFFSQDQKRYYFEFSAIVREYLGYVRGIPAAEMTSEELRRALTGDEDRLIVKLLSAADLVKFADAWATAERQAEELALVRAYIDATAPGGAA